MRASIVIRVLQPGDDAVRTPDNLGHLFLRDLATGASLPTWHVITDFDDDLVQTGQGGWASQFQAEVRTIPVGFMPLTGDLK